MKKTLILKKTLSLGLLLGLLASSALAQSPGQNVVTLPSAQSATGNANVSGTISVTNTFQSLWSAQNSRLGCLVQNNSTHSMWVYFGPIANATASRSVLLGASQTVNCDSNNGVASDQVSITGTSGDSFVAIQGPVSVGAASSSGSGGGGAVTVADGADVTEGTTTDAASSAGGAGTVSAKLRLMTTQLGTINTTLGSPIQTTGGTVGLVAGSAIVGKVGIDQTTPGTTNGVQINAALPAGSNVIGHIIADTGSTTAVTGNVTVVQGTGTNLHAVLDTTSTTAVTQTTAANLNAAVVGVGTAGTPSGGVLTIQGVTSMTKLLVTPDSVALPANQSVNESQINGVTPLMGNGVTGTGSQRVTIASDNTAFSTNSTLQTQTDTVMVGGVNIKEINAVTPLMGNGVTGTGSQRVTIASDNTAFSVNATVAAGTTGATPVPMVPAISTISTSITRPADTNAYAANDALSNSTSAPTSGGATFTSACRASGGYGTILDAVVSASAGTAYQGELWIYDQAATNINDNSAFTSSDSDILNLVGVIPFNTNDTTAANSISYITGLNIGYTCVGTANLRFLVKIMVGVTPASAEVLAARIKVQN